MHKIFFPPEENTPPDKELMNIISKVKEKREMLNSKFEYHMIL